VTAKAHHLGIQLGINEEKCRKVKELSRMYFVKDSPIKVDNRGENDYTILISV